jgi:quaternary ammonium compound-resistance protein SugE
MAWVIILAAGLFETGFAVALKMSHGMTRIWPTAVFAACALASFALLTIALRRLEVGAAYAVWTGIGAAGTALLGVMLYNEDAAPARVLLLVALIACIVGLKYVSAH